MTGRNRKKLMPLGVSSSLDNPKNEEIIEQDRYETDSRRSRSFFRRK